MKLKKGFSNLKKEFHDGWALVEKESTYEKCALCGKSIGKTCNSHIVPQFILKEISKDGKVSYGQSLFKGIEKIFETTKGIKNAFTFKLICGKCDKEKFKNYEDRNSILNFDVLENIKKKIILKEMAIKTHLGHISMKEKAVNFKRYSTYHRGQECEAQLRDIQEHKQYIKKLSNINEKTKFPFIIIYNKLLDYKTNIAAQTVICYTHDLEGNQIYDPYKCVDGNEAKYIYLMILPCEGRTRILLYVENIFLEKNKKIIEDFNKLTDEEKLHFIFISLIIHDEQFYINPGLCDKMKKDRRLIKLYQDTEINLANNRKIKNFKKYINYLVDKYSGEIE